MSDAAANIGASQRPTAPARRRWLVLLIATMPIGALVAWLVLRPAGPAPPAVDLTGADPAIATAIEAARAEVRAKPRSAAAWGRLGQLLRAHDFGDAANVCFSRAEQLDPTEPRWPYLHGATVSMTDRDAAIPLLERAAALSALEAPRLRLAEVLLMQGRVEEAERHTRQALRDAPHSARAHLDLARLACRRNALPEAQAHLDRVLAGPSGRKAALLVRAEILQRLGRQDSAQNDLNAAAVMADDPPWPDPFVEE